MICKIFSVLWSIFFWMLAAPALFAYELSICAIFQDEAPYLKEWIEFHRLQGVQHFYLYNNNSTDHFQEVLEPYIQSRQVTLKKWSKKYKDGAHRDWLAIQTGAYMDCIKKLGKHDRWIAFIDIDEFLFCPSGVPLPAFLKGYSKYGGLGVNWLVFGTSHIEDIPPGELLIEQLTRCCRYQNRQNRYYKSIVQPRYVKRCHSAHFFLYRHGRYTVDANRKRMPEIERSPVVLLDKIRIHHYWTRTEKYLREKKIPGRLKRRPEYTVKIQLKMAEKFNLKSDITILQFVDKLKKAL
ncbi:MAG: glycosyltransferase family 92 protein [Parachlamydia sp.]|nr:glycosyltransferase family 92 protein [Parachlamydia sp.]